MRKEVFTAETQRRREKIKQTLRLCASAVILLSPGCEKEITVSLPDADNKIVVEGVIEQGKHPYVMLTHNSNYFAPIGDFLDNLYVQNAIVVISDGIISDTLSLSLDQEILNPVPVLAYKSTLITGEIGKEYFLTVIAEGQTLTASTTIPTPVTLDSLWFKLKPGSSNDSIGYVWTHLHDPDTIGNNYRWFTKEFGRDHRYLPPDNSVWDDKFTNGQSYDFFYEHPDDPVSGTDTVKHHHQFFRGDTVVVKLCSIDLASYKFYHSLETVMESKGNPFAAPSSVFSNVNGGLGGWIGYGAFYDTLVIQ